MAIPVQAFDQHMAAWQTWQTAPWGRLRYSTAYRTLQRHIPTTPLQILDIGGGNGSDSLPFAEHGHHITLADYSAPMLAAAQQAAEERNIEERVHTLYTDVGALATHFLPATFDVIFCHNVLQYVDDAPLLLQTIGALLRPNGLLSIISPNPASEAYRLACMEYNLADAYAQLNPTAAFTTMFGVSVQRYTTDELQHWMQTIACPPVEVAGILCICGYLADNTRKYDAAFYAELERLEHAMSHTYPYYVLARFIHLIGQKHTTRTEDTK